MKKTTNFLSLIQCADVLNSVALSNVKGGTGDAEEDEWVLVYIDGKPVWVKKDSNGQIIEILVA